MTNELSGFSVLIADDDAIAQRLIESVLNSIGIEKIALAEDGAVALACHDVMPGGVDFVLLDIDMPGMDGLEFLRHLSHREIYPAIILIGGAANGGADKAVLFGAREVALAHGMRVIGEISKPIDPAALKPLLVNILPSTRLGASAVAPGVGSLPRPICVRVSWQARSRPSISHR